MSVLIVTSVGDIVIDLYTDRCPLTTKNFLKLCKIKYYNGCLFHKVEKDFTAQTGDRTGTGTGGDSVFKFLFGNQARFFEDEIHLELKHSRTGTIAMASAGENLNASQFYFTLRDDLDYLDGKHTVFGVVEEKEGLDTLTKINEAYVDSMGRPFKNIRIKHTYILDDPFDDPPQLSEFIPEKSPDGKPHEETAEEHLEDNWVPLDETLGPAELEQLIREKEAHANATILETIGDIPDADIKPPENVLFVCKLNPVTQDEDLFTIFSRFGTVFSADIIRDYKTGDSLCYAFIEFETKEACEKAYYKMDNTLIDDRRIHVDFSQSVAKLWGRYRRGKRINSESGGCYKCGSTDHIARECDQGSNNKNEHPKYVLKDENVQRGEAYKQRYEMVFDESGLEVSDQRESSLQEKSNRQKSDHQRSETHGDFEKHSEKYRSDHGERRYGREDERSHKHRSVDEHASKRDDSRGEKYSDRGHQKRHEDRRERHGEDYRRSLDDSLHAREERHRRDEGDYRRDNSDKNHRRREPGSSDKRSLLEEKYNVDRYKSRDGKEAKPPHDSDSRRSKHR